MSSIRLIKLLPLILLIVATVFLASGVVYKTQAQQYTVDYIPLDDSEPAPPFVSPNCLRERESDECFVAVFLLPKGLVADYDETTKRRRDQSINRSAYSRTRTGQAYVIAFPMEGGYVEVTEPGGPVLQNNRYRVQAYNPGDVLYYTVEKVLHTPAVADRRIQQNREAVFTEDLEFEDSKPTDRKDEPATRSRKPDTSPSTPQNRRDYRTQFLMSIDVSNVVRTSSNIFRDESLGNRSEGNYFGLTVYYLDRFQSARAGFTYLSSSGRSIQFTSTSFVEEEFTFSNFSLYASYSPHFSMYDSKTTYFIFYTDVGGSANLIDFYYNDYEEIDRGSFFDITEIEYEIDSVWAPGFNVGAGLILNYKKLGFHVGALLDLIYVQALDTYISSLYPKVGINIRRNPPSD